MNVMEHTRKIYLLFLFVVVGWTKDLTTCMNMVTCGYTVPSGDIILKYGEPLNITCNLYPDPSKFPQEQNSSILYFMNEKFKIIPFNKYDKLNETEERVEILNLTSIRLTVSKPKPMKKFYYCRCIYNDKIILACSNAVIVGIPPQKIDNFSCKSDNWESMTCSWTVPENYVKTTYNVSFTYPEYINPEKQYVDYSSNENDHIMFFTLRTNSSPFYRQAQETFKFLIEMNNTFGYRQQNIDWSHFDNIYLKPPEGLNGTATSPSDIILRWNLSTALPAFPRKLLHKIKYKCEHFCDSWKLASLYSTGKKVIHYNLTNLEYAHVHYDIRVSIKVEHASDKTWSSASGIVIRTKSKIPDYPPPTTLGSFQFVNSQPRQVYVYFQQIKPQSENGENFSYFVESDPPLRLAEKTTSADAYVKLVGLEERKRYTIRIWSQNKIGKSRKWSVVIIPSHPAKEPFKLWKIVHTHVKYELEWQRRDTDNYIISNYTLFWCEHQFDRPYQCPGFLNWTIVPSNITRYNVTVPPSNNIYQFAIAANTMEGSSGMVWASCTILANRTVSKINELIIKNVGSNFIELNWRQDCPDLNSEVTGYVIYYCATNNTSNDSCSTPEKNVTLNGSLSDQSGTVGGLTPYTTYLLAVSVKTKSAIGVRSEYVRNVTEEAAPSTPPLDITIDDITNSSITIHWKRPIITNGNIKNYNIWYNNNTGPQPIAGDLESYTLTNLESYKSYAISMQACTTKCSTLSNESLATTKMGTPGQPGQPYQNETTENGMKIVWKRPEQPRGDIQYYQILITTNKDNVTGKIIKGSNSEFFVYESCQASNKYSNYVTYIRVRAVNIIGNEHYPGLWSNPFINPSCSLQISWYIIYIVFGILVIILLGFGSRKVYDYFKLMKELDIILPAGLAPAVEKNLTVIDRFCPDEELLLEKMPEKCKTGDSSGCSSGQDSISSSVESTTHSSIDSGTDQPKSVSDDPKENSLRLRNVSSKGYMLHDATPTINRGTKPTPTATGNYCVLGVDPSTKPSQDTPYVTISDIETATLPCISNDKPSSGQAPYTDFFKTPNPGYVSFSNPDPADKNTGYVIAGDLSLPSVEIKTDNVLADTSVVGLKPATVWQQPPVEPSLAKPGYVSVGDAPPHVAFKEASKGYVPHRQFEAKSLKED